MLRDPVKCNGTRHSQQSSVFTEHPQSDQPQSMLKIEVESSSLVAYYRGSMSLFLQNTKWGRLVITSPQIGQLSHGYGMDEDCCF